MVAGEGGSGDGSTAALTREVARNSVARLSEGLTRLAGETSAILRWLLAAMLALNAAGFWFCLSRPDLLPSGHDRELLAHFFLGMLAAILAALLSLVLTLPLAGALRRAVTVWTEVSASGSLSDEALASARRVRLLSGLWLGLTSLVGFVSLLLFVIGALVIAADLRADRTDTPPVETPAPAAPAPNAAAPLNAAAPPMTDARPEPPRAAAPPSGATPSPRPRPTPSATPRPAATPAPRAPSPSPHPTPRPSAPAAASSPAPPPPSPAPTEASSPTAAPQ